jgi:hypothetical protein
MPKALDLSFAKYMPKDLTEDYGKNIAAGWSKKLMINQWDNNTLEKIIKSADGNSTFSQIKLTGKIPI